jgi:hypothetical protein
VDSVIWIDPDDVTVEESHLNNFNNPHKVTASQVGARPNGWLPTPSEIGAGIDVKLLWEGSWKSDELPVPNTDKYTGFQIGMSGQGTTILAMKYGTHIRGMGGYTDKDGKVTTYHFTATFSGNEWTWVGCDSFYHYANGQHSTNTSNTVSRIYGVF